MKIGNLMNLIQDGEDISMMFEGVESRDQMVSLLERLKRGDGPEDLLACVIALRMSIDRLRNDIFEFQASNSEQEQILGNIEGDEEADDGDDDFDLTDLAEVPEGEKEEENSLPTTPEEEKK